MPGDKISFLVGRVLCAFTDKNNPKPIGIPCIITKLIRTANHFTRKFFFTRNS